MGCTSSKAEAPAPPIDFQQTGAGSIILAAPAGGRKLPSHDETIDELFATRGGSMIVGRKDAGAWEPGTEIVRPDSTSSTQTAYIPAGKGKRLRLTYAAISMQGRSPRPPHKPNQDSFVISVGLGNNPACALFAVFDGHGPKGEDASNYCRINIPDLTVRNPTFNDSPFDALCASFEAAHRKFTSPSTQRAGVDTQVSGSTAVAVMLDGEQWVCANVGDSRAALGSTAASADGTVIGRPLSSDHKPLRPDERARILKAGARILSEKQLGIEGGDADKLYVCRVANGAIRYGVLFTRSIGDADAHTHLGLSSTPEIRRGTLEPAHDSYIVLATDGVWDHLSEADVNALIVANSGSKDGKCPGEDAQSAATAVVEAARARWDGTGDKRRDDITVVLVFLKEEKEDKEEAAAPKAVAATTSPAATAAAGAAGPPAPAGSPHITPRQGAGAAAVPEPAAPSPASQQGVDADVGPPKPQLTSTASSRAVEVAVAPATGGQA